MPRSSYYRPTNPAAEYEEHRLFMRIIDEETTQHPLLVSRKMRDYCRRQAYRINRKRVQRLMRPMGLVSVAPKPNTSFGNKAHMVYPYLLPKLTINRVVYEYLVYTHAWWLYLVAVMDWHSRKVLSWE